MRWKMVTVVVAGLIVLAGCEDALTPQLQELVRVAELPTRQLTIQPPANGNVAPTGTQTIKDGEPLSISVTANSGFSFLYWEQVSGGGTASFGDDSATETTVSVTGGDATIRAAISSTPRTLTITSDGNGTTAPSGATTVGEGIARSIEAFPATGYNFNQWSKTGGAGTVSFSDSGDASTTVTVTGGDATIEATFALKTYTITVDNTAGGSVSTSSVNVSHGIQSGTITATPSVGYDFTGWTVTSGTGLAIAPNASSQSIQITATGGNATIRANFALKTYTLNVSSGTGGFVNPGGNRTVTHGVPFDINAYPSGTYIFDGWSKSGGAGSVVFGDSNSASTNVTVTGGSVQIQASFRKESVSLSKVGELNLSECCTTYPEDVDAIYHAGTTILIGGRRWSNNSNGVIRQIDISNPASPSEGSSAYLTGTLRDLTGSGSTVFASTSSGLYSFSGVTPSGSATGSFGALAYDRDGRNVVWANNLSAGEINEYSSSSLSGSYFRLLDSFGSFREVLSSAWGGLITITEDNGSHRLNTYDLDGVTSATRTAPDDYVTLHTGADMDPGDAGPWVQDVDEEYLFVYVYEPNSVPNHRIRFFDVTDPASISTVGSPGYVGVSDTVNGLDTDDYYIYAAGVNGSSAYVTIIDMYSKTNPVVRTNQTISGFSTADAVVVQGNYLYVFLDNPSEKPTLYVYEIVRS